MATLLLSHPACLQHVTPAGHPERADRLRAIDQVLADPAFANLVRESAPRADIDSITRCHPRAYVDEVRAASPAEGLVRLDGDTTMSPGSLEAAERAVGGAMRAVDAVIKGEVANAFVCTRPPGHHAETDTAMGFCIFNNAAIAARHAQAVHGIGKVAIIDFDVHHGNGTQEIFWSDPSVMYCSTHQMPLYPGTGAADERGRHGTIVNAPLRPGDGGPEFRAAMTGRILPRLAEFGPELVIISAGFDAHMRDPLANLAFVEDDFAWATAELLSLARGSAERRVVSLLEGGYDLQGLAQSVAAHVAALEAGADDKAPRGGEAASR